MNAASADYQSFEVGFAPGIAERIDADSYRELLTSRKQLERWSDPITGDAGLIDPISGQAFLLDDTCGDEADDELLAAH